MATVMWGAEAAARYDAAGTEMFDPAVLGPAVDMLEELAAGGPALEFAIGTGRIALPLAARGVDVAGIELSRAMVARLRAKPGGADIPVVIGDMSSATIDGPFSLVYLVYNTIENLTAQDEQVAVFANAAAHLRPGGRFLLEVEVPSVPRIPPGERGRIFHLSPTHAGIDTHDDPVGQLMSSHHWTLLDGQWVQASGQYRYVWPSELDLMARLAGLRFEARWAGWDRSPFTAASPSQVVVYAKPA